MNNTNNNGHSDGHPQGGNTKDKKLKYDPIIDMAETIQDIKYHLSFVILLFCFILLYFISWTGSSISISVSSFNS